MEGAATTTGGPGVSGGQLKPLGVGETLDRAIKLYRSNAVALWKIVAIIIVPVNILELVVRRVTLPSDVFVHSGTLYTYGGSQSAGASVAVLLAVLLGLLAQIVATGAVIKLQIDAYLGKPHTVSDTAEYVRHRLPSLLWLAFLSWFFIVLGFILLVVPGIWLVVSISVSVPVLMVEGHRGLQAIKRSIALVDGRWWATLGRLLAAWLLYGVGLAIAGAISGAINTGVHNVTLLLTISAVINTIAVILLSPFIAAVYNVMYIDLRVRKEALDLELLAAGFGGSGLGGPGLGGSGLGGSGLGGSGLGGSGLGGSGLGGSDGSVAPPAAPPPPAAGTSTPPPAEPTWPPPG